MMDQIRTISKRRLISKIGNLPLEGTEKIENKIKTVLRIDLKASGLVSIE